MGELIYRSNILSHFLHFEQNGFNEANKILQSKKDVVLGIMKEVEEQNAMIKALEEGANLFESRGWPSTDIRSNLINLEDEQQKRQERLTIEMNTAMLRYNAV